MGTPPTVKPSKVLRMVKEGKLPHSFHERGKIYCARCGRKHAKVTTDGPAFWSNGMYVFCPHCKDNTLANPRFPACDAFPDGFVIDLSGERKKYPMIMEQEET